MDVLISRSQAYSIAPNILGALSQILQVHFCTIVVWGVQRHRHGVQYPCITVKSYM